VAKVSSRAAGGDFADGIIAYEGDWPGEKSLCLSTRRLSLYCGPDAVVPGGRLAREEYFTTDPVVIVVAKSGNGAPLLYVSSKKAPLDELGNTVRGAKTAPMSGSRR
jgi:hypothetical protein